MSSAPLAGSSGQNEDENPDGAWVVVCAGPPLCLAEGDDAMERMDAGCLKCEQIFVAWDEPAVAVSDQIPKAT